ncbi:MAG: hypothetical protein ACLQLG_03280 [Thermoguttaceae bacterium]
MHVKTTQFLSSPAIGFALLGRTCAGMNGVAATHCPKWASPPCSPCLRGERRVAKIERAATDVSLDQLVRAFAAAGGRIVVKVGKAKAKKDKAAKKRSQGTLIVEAAASK